MNNSKFNQLFKIIKETNLRVSSNIIIYLIKVHLKGRFLFTLSNNSVKLEYGQFQGFFDEITLHKFFF